MSNKIKRLADSALMGLYFLLSEFQKSQLGTFGAAGLILLPFLDAFKTLSYWQLNQNKSEKRLSLAFHTLKTFSTFAAIFALAVGASIISLTILTAAQGALSLRSFGKSLHAYWMGDTRKGTKHVLKSLVSGAYAAAFALVFVMTAYVPIGWALAMGATGLSILISFAGAGKKNESQAQIKRTLIKSGVSRFHMNARLINIYHESIEHPNGDIKPYHKSRAVTTPAGRSLFMLYNDQQNAVQPSFSTETLGEGTTARVKKHLVINGEYIAVKRVKFENRTFAEDFYEEVAVLKALGRYRGHGTTSKYGVTKGYLAMLYYPGTSLGDIVGDNEDVPLFNNLTHSTIVALMLSMVAEVKFLHDKGYVHNDIKPGNFIVDVDKKEAKLIDFGYARKSGVEMNGGTPRYAPPEAGLYQDFYGTLLFPFTKRWPDSDIHSLGQTFERMIGTMRNFSSPNKLPLLQLTRHMMSDHPHQRPSLDVVAAQLKTLCPHSSNTILNTSR